MLKRTSKEESQIIDLFRKIKKPYNRYLAAEYIRMNAKEATGKEEQIPEALECCDRIYRVFCLAARDVKETFPKEKQHCKMLEKMLDDLEESTKKDMERAYYGKN